MVHIPPESLGEKETGLPINSVSEDINALLTLKTRVIEQLKNPGFPDLQFLFSSEALAVAESVFSEVMEEEKIFFQKLCLKNREELNFSDIDFFSYAEYYYTLLYHIKNCRLTEQNNRVLGSIEPIFLNFEKQKYQNKEYYELLQYLFQKKELEDWQRRVLKLRMKKCEENGIGLDEDKKNTILSLQEELSKLSGQYMTHITQSRASISFHVENEQVVKRLPAHILKMALHRAQEKGQTGYIFSFTVADEQALLKFCDDEFLRKKVHISSITLAAEKNQDIAFRMIQLRKSLAKILGVPRYGDISFQTKMAKTPEQVIEIYTQEAENNKKIAYETVNLLLSHFGLTEISAWDFSYYMSKYLEEVYQVDDNFLQNYLSYENIIPGIFQVIEKVYGVIFEETKIQTYDNKVKVYTVVYQGKPLGYYMPDFFSDPGKRPGGWAEVLRKSTTGKKIVTNVSNFSKSSDNENYLSRYDIRVVFHELGHMLHELLSPIEHGDLSGFQVESDAVEIYSKFNENFILEQEALEIYMKHKDSKTWLPENIGKSLRESNTISKPFIFLDGIMRSLFDLSIHGEDIPKNTEELQKRAYEYYKKFTLFSGALEEEYMLHAHFYHLFHSAVGTYVAGFYSYIWSDILQEQIWSKVKEQGSIFGNPQIKKYMDEMLSQGARKPSMELFQKVMEEKNS